MDGVQGIRNSALQEEGDPRSGSQEPASKRDQRRKVVLAIAGFDPSSGAGVTADLKVFSAFDLYGMACITGLTVQSTLGVRSVEPVSARLVTETLATLTADVNFAGIKLGMLATVEICEAVSDFLDQYPDVPVVLDPVLRSSSGRELLHGSGVHVLRERILKKIDWATPNWGELSILTGLKVNSREDVPPAAQQLQSFAATAGDPRLNVLITGGDLAKPDDFLLTRDGEAGWIPGDRVETEATHGTGCALSSALLCLVVKGESARAAATGAKEYVAAALRSAYPVGRGKGPMHHLFRLDDAGAG